MMKVRPRLAAHALLRRHVTDGEARIVMHDARSGALMLLDERALGLCLAADGTRDVDGVALALARRGLYRRQSEIEAVLARLDDAGLLVDGIESAPVDTLEQGCTLTPLTPDRQLRTIIPLPGYRFACGTRGGCCSQHATVAVTRDDLARGRRAGLSALAESGDALLPLAGSVAFDRRALPLVDGACSERSSDGLCGLHARGGPEAKPVACAVYPRTYVDDGVAIRLSYGCECDCVFDSLQAAEGSPKGAVDGAVTAGALVAGVAVRSLPTNVALTGSSSAAREAIAEWSSAVCESEILDGVVGLMALAGAVESRGLEVSASRAALAASPEELPAPFESLLGSLSQRAAAAADSADAWRSPRDRTRLMRRVVSAAAELASSSEPARTRAFAEGVRAVDERFAVRAALFGHHLVGGAPLVDGLRELAVRLFVARMLAQSGSDLGHPIAVVMATLRGI